MGPAFRSFLEVLFQIGKQVLGRIDQCPEYPPGIVEMLIVGDSWEAIPQEKFPGSVTVAGLRLWKYDKAKHIGNMR